MQMIPRASVLTRPEVNASQPHFLSFTVMPKTEKVQICRRAGRHLHERRSHDRSLRSHEESMAHKSEELLDQAEPPRDADFDSRRHFYAAQLEKELDGITREPDDANANPPPHNLEQTQDLSADVPAGNAYPSGGGQREGAQRRVTYAASSSSFREQVCSCATTFLP